ncbi:ABC transporter permease [Devosia psychrophila]|uniref:Simple sugar transport system permease protein n=1 Tax=Devosia psychrophila TaxID=728005 RepID=A0A0F5PWN8_9HYPH|nr:ABC transporter permease [Devosia psychrophila]KKC32244.1 sugar ABC transporter permease [Devosia psychrophila]SFD33577.1 simple sugar transport system permease protein [Devosia psychrophila]
MGIDLVLDPAFLQSVPRFLTPILLAALGGAICERAGVFNIALEGFILVGAFCAVLGSYFMGSEWWGAVAAMAGGVGMGLLFAEFSLRRKGDAIVVSIALNLFAAGLTVYLLRTIFGVSGAFRDSGIKGFSGIDIPLLRDIPVLGPLLNGQSILFYFAVFAALALQLFFARHRLGLRLRAAGENPAGLSAGGVDPQRVQLWALVLCGALCGLAGAQLSIANVNLFVENMSAGRGWIAVVAVLLTRGRPLYVLFIAVLFGFVDSLSFRIQGFGLPQQFTDVMPYLATLIALIVLSAWHKSKTA